MSEITDLLGKTISKIKRNDNDSLLFTLSDGQQFKMYHDQDCCESVEIEDVVGDLNELIGSPVTMAEEVTEEGDDSYGTHTWTFYRLATVKGYVTIRWYGSSNGYYSESVSFEKIN